jgi:hypothetical protein
VHLQDSPKILEKEQNPLFGLAKNKLSYCYYYFNFQGVHFLVLPDQKMDSLRIKKIILDLQN